MHRNESRYTNKTLTRCLANSVPQSFLHIQTMKRPRKADLKTTNSKSHKNEVFKYNLITSSYQSSQRDLFQLFILFRWSDREILRNWISNLATKISSTNKKTRKSTDVKKKQHIKKYFLLPVNRPTVPCVVTSLDSGD